MNGYPGRRSVVDRQTRRSKARLACEALEGRQLLSRGMGLDAIGGMGGGRRLGSGMAELGSFGGGRSGAMFGSGNLGIGGGTRDPIFLLTASLLNTGSGTTTPPSRSALSSSAVQTAFQTLQTDLSDDVTVGSKPTHATTGQLQDDLTSIRKGTLTGTAATTAIQNDEAAILTSMGLSSTQVSQIQSDLQAVQSAIQSAATSGTGTTTTTTTGTTTTTSGTTSATATTSSAGATSGSTTVATAPLASSTTTTTSTSTTPAPSSAVQTAFQTLQSDLKSDLSVGAQPTHASVGQLQDDLDAISKGTLTGSQAVTTVQTDAAAVLTSAGLSQSQVTQIQSDQTALASAIQANSTQSSGTTSSTSSSTASPTSIAAVQATTQSVQPYLVALPGFGGPGIVGVGMPVMDGVNPGGPMLAIAQGNSGGGGGFSGGGGGGFSGGGGGGVRASGGLFLSKGSGGIGAVGATLMRVGSVGGGAVANAPFIAAGSPVAATSVNDQTVGGTTTSATGG